MPCLASAITVTLAVARAGAGAHAAPSAARAAARAIANRTRFMMGLLAPGCFGAFAWPVTPVPRIRPVPWLHAPRSASALTAVLQPRLTRPERSRLRAGVHALRARVGARALAPLARPRLVRALAGEWKLGTLAAPAGWGKTTVLAQWCAGRDTLWVTATSAERDPAQLLGSLLAAGSRLAPPFGARTLARYAARREFERDGVLLTATFLHELAERGRATVVAIDDAHELAGARAALAWLAGIVERSPAAVRFVFAGRGEPPWPEGRFGALGERHIARAELAFDAREAGRLLAAERVPVAERAAIVERQQGWAAGLRAAARAREAGDVAWSTLVARELDALTASERTDLLLASQLDGLEQGVLDA